MKKEDKTVDDLVEEAVMRRLSKKEEVIICKGVHCDKIKIDDQWKEAPSYIMGIIDLYKNKHRESIIYETCDKHKKIFEMKALDVDKRKSCGCKDCCGKHYGTPISDGDDAA